MLSHHQPLDVAAVRARFEEIAEGSKVMIQFIHVRDLAHLRTIRGRLMQSRDGWVVMPTATQRFRFPSDETQIISISVLEPATREPSTPPNDDAIDDDISMIQVQDLSQPNLSQVQEVISRDIRVHQHPR